MRIFLLPCVAVCGLAFASAVPACSSSSAGGSSASDSGVDAASTDAGKDGSTFFPPVDSGTHDAATECDSLKATVDRLGLAARACSPNGSQVCNAATDGPCCSVTVSSSNVTAVNDYDQAVKAYKTKCTPDCSRIICEQTPSGVCDGAGSSSGTCR